MGLNGVATRRYFLLMSGALVLGVSAGCASRAVRSSSPYARELPLTFKDDAVRSQLKSLGMMTPFFEYWQAHAHRRWADRYQMERFVGDLAESFYVAYHDAAWMIQNFSVVKTHEPDQMGRIRVDIDVTYQSLIEPDKTSRQLVQDWWVNENGKWWHVNVDPMLNGMRPVL
jgi:hypothetical protein